MVKRTSIVGQTHRFNRHALALLVMTTPGMAASPQAIAGPRGGEVVGGSGSITQSGSNTTILQNSQNMAID